MGEAFAQLAKEDPVAWRRSDLVVSTKLFWGGSGVNEKGLSRKHVREGLRASLERLKMDYVDIVFCHRPDELTPTEEVVQAFTEEIQAGRAFYWGTSEWSAQQITEAYWIAKVRNLIPPVVEQPEYNLFKRERFEVEYRRLYQNPYRMATTIWGPLNAGILTGKYNQDIPKGSRLDHYAWLRSRYEDSMADRIAKTEELMKYAKANFNTSSTCLAIAWVVKNPNVSTALLGASKESQIEENLKALSVARQLTPQHMEEIEAIVKSKPQGVDFYGRDLKKTF